MYLLSFLAFLLSIIFSLIFKTNQELLMYATWLLGVSIAFAFFGFLREVNITINVKNKRVDQASQDAISPSDKAKFSKELNKLERQQ